MTQYTVVKTFKTFRHSLYHRTPSQVLDIICDDLGDHSLTDLNQAIERYQNHQFRDFTAQVIAE